MEQIRAEDYSLWIYIILAAIGWLYNMVRKQQQKSAEQNSPSADRDSETDANNFPKDFSFEDMLQEFQNKQKGDTEVVEEESKEEVLKEAEEGKYFTYDAKFEDEEKKYEESKAAPVNEYQKYASVGVDKEKVLLENKRIRKPRSFEDSRIKKNEKTNPYGIQLKKKKQLREAFINSEILKRKHF